jgi:uncharacterized membrane protein YkvA (DUF1232 family)
MCRRWRYNKHIPSRGGILGDIALRVRLILRLMGDRRVSFWSKLIPIGALIYLVSPIDAIMGIPVVDALDDAAVLWLGYYLFVELAPPEVVKEHLQNLTSNEALVDDAKRQQHGSDDVIDAEVTDDNK